MKTHTETPEESRTRMVTNICTTMVCIVAILTFAVLAMHKNVLMQNSVEKLNVACIEKTGTPCLYEPKKAG